MEQLVNKIYIGIDASKAKHSKMKLQLFEKLF